MKWELKQHLPGPSPAGFTLEWLGLGGQTNQKVAQEETKEEEVLD